MLKRLFFYLMCMFLTGVATAAPDRNDISPPSTSQQNDNRIKVTGYIDGSYNYLLRSNSFISGVNDRVFDLAENGFTLQQAALVLAKQSKQGLGGFTTLILGRDANNIAPNGFDSNVFDARDIGFVIPEAYLQYAKSTFTFYAGELTSQSGYEEYEYTQDMNFSRSILFGYAQPGSYIGLKLADQINDQINVAIGVGNGWNTIHRPTQINKIEAGIIYTPISTFSLTVDGYAGWNQYLTDTAESGPTGKRYLIDIFATWSATEKLNFATNIDYGTQNKAELPTNLIGRAIWQGIGGYVQYKWNEKWYTSVRGEIFADTDGYRTGVKQNWREITLSLGYSPIKHLLLRAETRHDFSNVGAFLDKNNINTSNNQQSYALDVLYQFG